jgi:hypothetical protein
MVEDAVLYHRRRIIMGDRGMAISVEETNG